MRFSNLYRATLICILTIVMFACARKTPPPPPEEVEPLYYEHMVKFPGETMGLISRWYTGTADNWKEILTYNPGLNVYRIKKGDLVKIPDFLITRRQPLPRTFVERAYSSAATTPQKSAQTAVAPPKPADSSPAKSEEVKSVSPEQALPSVSREQAPAALEVQQAQPPAPVNPEAASLSAQVRQEVDKTMQAPAAVPPEQPQAAAQPRAKTREELLRELLDEGAAAPQ